MCSVQAVTLHSNPLASACCKPSHREILVSLVAVDFCYNGINYWAHVSFQFYTFGNMTWESIIWNSDRNPYSKFETVSSRPYICAIIGIKVTGIVYCQFSILWMHNCHTSSGAVTIGARDWPPLLSSAHPRLDLLFFVPLGEEESIVLTPLLHFSGFCSPRSHNQLSPSHSSRLYGLYQREHNLQLPAISICLRHTVRSCCRTLP